MMASHSQEKVQSSDNADGNVQPGATKAIEAFAKHLVFAANQLVARIEERKER